MGGPGPAEQATDGDDRIGEVEEGVDDGRAAFVAAGEAVEGVLPGVCALDMPPLTGLDRRKTADGTGTYILVNAGGSGDCFPFCSAAS